MKHTNKTIFSFNRAGGILLHPTSLPGDYGIGDIGTNAYKFVDFLKKNNFRVWQILPLGPTGYGNSPYQCFSAFAGNPYLISIEQITKDYKVSDNIQKPDVRNPAKIDYEPIIQYKMAFLKNFFENYFTKLKLSTNEEYLQFKNEQEYWLHDYALFMSIKDQFNQKSWLDWDLEFKLYNKKTLQEWSDQHTNEIEFHKFVQFLFFSQWTELKTYANSNGITIVGDIPIYVSLDSSDVWSNQKLFFLKEGKPMVVAGVPPDFFSKTGQLWGNPIYNWPLMKKNGYKWWLSRISQMLQLVDIIRLDHFRGFEAYWEVPGTAKTAETGKWIKGPDESLFKVLKKKFSPLPLIAEDLGVITPEVNELRKKFSFPGMKILQMAFGDHDFVEKRFLPHNIEYNSVSYTGTHDNLPILGWWNESSDETKESVLEYLNDTEDNIISNLIRTVWASTSALAVIPMQDLLHLGSDSRMNFPGTLSNNWEWRFQWSDLREQYIEEVQRFTEIYERLE